jgi:hypothetical protein
VTNQIVAPCFSALARHIGETMQARSRRRIVRREAKCTGFTAGYRMTLEAAPSCCAPKMMSAEWWALSAFLSACSTQRRDDAGAFAAPNRQAEGEVYGFTAGYRMTLGAAPSRFAPKMMAGEWKALSVFLSACSTYRRDDAGAFAAPIRQAEGEIHGFTAGFRMTLGPHRRGVRQK